MRLKKIPKGTKIIMFQNETEKDCILYLDKKPFNLIGKGCFCLWEAKTFFIRFPMDEFPQWQFYSNVKIRMDFK